MTAPRVLLNPARRVLWRASGSLQLGVDPSVAVVIDGVDQDDSELISLLDGSRGVAQVAAMSGTDPDRAQRIIDALRSAGALVEPKRRQTIPARLQPDALAASLVRPDGDAVTVARAERRVDVIGAGRVGSAIAMLLSAAGVGDVRVVDDTMVQPTDLLPAGIRQLVTSTRSDAIAGAVALTSPWPKQRPPDDSIVDLVVVAPTDPTPAPELGQQLRQVPHLPVCIRETVAAIGPLVVPGATACRRCAELRRADRDPQWPWLSAQLAGIRGRMEPCDVALATAAAGLAGLHVLRFLDDRAGDHPLAGGIVELSMNDLRQRRRTVLPHPDCGCGATVASARVAGPAVESGQ